MNLEIVSKHACLLGTRNFRVPRILMKRFVTKIHYEKLCKNMINKTVRLLTVLSSQQHYRLQVVTGYKSRVDSIWG